jgi:hypothetical protein
MSQLFLGDSDAESQFHDRCVTRSYGFKIKTLWPTFLICGSTGQENRHIAAVTRRPNQYESNLRSAL